MAFDALAVPCGFCELRALFIDGSLGVS